METGILKEGDKVQTNARYLEEFGKPRQFERGIVTGVVPDEDGELIFVDHYGIDVHWLEKVEPTQTSGCSPPS